MHNVAVQTALTMDAEERERMEMAARLREARARKGFKSATEAARSLRIAQQTYLAHENGSRGFKRRATVYAAAFKCDLKWLLTGIGPVPGKPVESEFFGLSPAKQAQVLEYIEFINRDKKNG